MFQNVFSLGVGCLHTLSASNVFTVKVSIRQVFNCVTCFAAFGAISSAPAQLQKRPAGRWHRFVLRQEATEHEQPDTTEVATEAAVQDGPNRTAVFHSDTVLFFIVNLFCNVYTQNEKEMSTMLQETVCFFCLLQNGKTRVR